MTSLATQVQQQAPSGPEVSGHPFGINTNRLRHSLVAARELEDLAGTSFKFLRGAEYKLAQFDSFAPFLARLVEAIGEETTPSDEEANSLLPIQSIQRRAPNTIRPLLAEGSELPGKIAMGAIRTLMEDETGQEWLGSQIDKASPVEYLDFENPRLQLIMDTSQFMNGAQAVARVEAAKTRGGVVDPAHPDRGVKPEHVGTGLETMLRGIASGDEQMLAAMPLLGVMANRFLPADFKIPSKRMLSTGAYTLISAMNDALPKEYRNLQLQRDAWRPNVMARTALFFARGSGVLPETRKIMSRLIAHTIMALPYNGQEIQAPYRTLRSRFPSKQLAT